MSDIVQRLRNEAVTDDAATMALLDEAADEIERLQGILDWLYERIISESDQ